MANPLTRFDPFRELAHVEPLRGFEDFLKDFRLSGLGTGMDTEPKIRMDVSENDEAYTVKAEIPGVTKQDIHVSIEGNLVSITAESRREHEEKSDDRVIRSERYYGRQSRRFSLPQDIDDSKASARYTDGMLELTLPKRPGSGKAKQLSVS